MAKTTTIDDWLMDFTDFTMAIAKSCSQIDTSLSVLDAKINIETSVGSDLLDRIKEYGNEKLTKQLEIKESVIQKLLEENKALKEQLEKQNEI